MARTLTGRAYERACERPFVVDVRNADEAGTHNRLYFADEDEARARYLRYVIDMTMGVKRYRTVDPGVLHDVAGFGASRAGAYHTLLHTGKVY